MSGIVSQGTAANLINDVVGGALVPSATERKFVTFVNELGGVHTIIVDVEHAAKTADELLQWFEHTRAIASTSHSVETSDHHVAPADVIAHADALMGFTKQDSGGESFREPATDRTGG